MISKRNVCLMLLYRTTVLVREYN